jgi:biopolymer transport protein ExbD
VNLSRRRREEPEINLTPLIDVVFLMLIFFMVSTTFLRQSELRISLPEASQEPSQAVEKPLELTINTEGTVFLDGKPLVNSQRETIERALDKAAGDRDPAKMELVIRADGRTRHQLVVTALDAAGRAGFRNVGIATVPEEQ